MPEIGEVARVVHYIRKNLVGKTLLKVVAEDDGNVFGKVGTSGNEVMKALTGKKVAGASQQGKYFWMTMSSPPHLLMHFGMTGWLKFRNEETFYYKPSKDEGEDPEWPPRFWKFQLETAETPKCEAAFVDSRRFARVRLIDCDAAEIRNVSPLSENGPDPVVDKDIFTENWLGEKLRSKRVPVKALLLDQANISGIGNWVGDEILYDARIHPEQYSNTLSAAQIKQLYKSIEYVCGFAVEHLADSEKFPEEWLFKHRWGKGKKDKPMTLPNGLRFVHLTVGGRTSCVVPSVQKKTGPVSKDIEGGSDGDENAEEETEKPASKTKKSTTKFKKTKAEPASKTSKARKRAAKNEEEENPADSKSAKSRKRGVKKEEQDPAEGEVSKDQEEEDTKPAAKKRKSNPKSEPNGTADNAQTKPKNQKKSKSATNGVKKEEPVQDQGRRRSTRKSG
ncbi:hypothetical protein ACLMJK_003999 [Lecanora helva]